MAEVTKIVGNRITNSRAVVSALDVQAQKCAPDIAKKLFGDEPPRRLDVAEFIDLFARALERDTNRMLEEEQALVSEQADDPAARSARDTAMASLRTELNALGAAIEGTFGYEERVRYQLAAPMPKTPELARTQAMTALNALKRGAPRAAPGEGMALDFGALARRLDARIQALAEAVAAVSRENKEEQQALAARDSAVAAFEPTYTAVANFAVGVLELAGQSDLAERVKPTVRRRSGFEGTPTEDGPTDPTLLDPTAPGGPFDPGTPPS
jgi:hypothetical protein